MSFLLLIVLAAAGVAHTQQLGPEQDPPSLQWRHLRTPGFEVLFPAILEPEAQRVAATLEQIRGPVARSLGGRLRPTMVVLRNQTVQANGFAALGPRRSEWFSTPPQNPSLLGSDDWYTLLAVHEMRHLVQFDRLDRGFTRAAGLLLGDQGRLVFSFLSTPLWFWEGDAVGVETALTQGGRGRRPAFDLEIRALLLSGRRYSYYKAYLRSYKDWYPNHYHLGYLLTTHLRRTRGAAAWNPVLERAARWSFYPFSFSRAVRKSTGQSLTRLYEAAMDEADSLWRQQVAGLSVTAAQRVNAAARQVWTNYLYPQYTPEGDVVALKEGLAHPPTLVRLRADGHEQDLGQIAPLDPISVAGGMVAWSEWEPDPRWGYRDYTALVVRELATGRSRRLVRRTKLFAPALSPGGERIAAVDFGPDRKCRLVVLDARDGRQLAAHASPENALLQTPWWSPDGAAVACLRQDPQGTAVAAVELASGRWADLIPATREVLARPVFFRHYLLYSSPVRGLDAIWATDLHTGQQYQVSSRPLGAFSPAVSPDSTRLLFQDYTVFGYDAAQMPLDPSTWVPLAAVPDRQVGYWKPLVDQEEPAPVLPAPPPPEPYPVEAYHPLAHALDVHSWYLLPVGPTRSIGVYSTDMLNTTSLRAALDYQTEERAPMLRLAASYAGRWPILDLDLELGQRVSTGTEADGTEHTDTWREKSLGCGVRLPVQLSSGIYLTGLSLSGSAELTAIAGKERVAPLAKGNGTFAPLTWQARYQRLRVAAARDLYPRWGQGLDLLYRHTPLPGDYRASQASAQLELYAPGLRRHHGLRLQGGWERHEPDSYRFARYAAFPRGYRPVLHQTLYRGSVDYALPLAYPDLALGGLLYAKRLTAALFTDSGVGQDAKARARYAAAGAEVAVDFHVFSLPIRWTAGVRYAYRLDRGDSAVEAVLFGVGR